MGIRVNMDEQPKRRSNWNRSKFTNNELRPILYKHGFRVGDVDHVQCDSLDDRITIILDQSFMGSIVSVLPPERKEEVGDHGP